MNKISILSRSGLAALGALAVSPAHAAWTLNMNEGVTDLTSKVFGLHMLIFWICVVIGIGVFGAMLYSVIVHRKKVARSYARDALAASAAKVERTLRLILLGDQSSKWHFDGLS